VASRNQAALSDFGHTLFRRGLVVFLYPSLARRGDPVPLAPLRNLGQQFRSVSEPRPPMRQSRPPTARRGGLTGAISTARRPF
jgi:hypothetical protein